MFIRRCAIAWGISNNRQISINKVELFDAALIIMQPFNTHDGQLKNSLYAALDFYKLKTTYTFLEMSNIFHKYMIFSSMLQHSSINGALSRNKLLRAIDDTIGPSDLFLVD